MEWGVDTVEGKLGGLERGGDEELEGVEKGEEPKVCGDGEQEGHQPNHGERYAHKDAEGKEGGQVNGCDTDFC